MLLHVDALSPARETFAALLKRVLKRAGMTQLELAGKSDVPLATINAWITGRRVPANNARAKDQLRAMADQIPGVTVREFFEAIGQQVPGELDPEGERRVLDLYRNLSPGRRKIADQLMETLAAEERERVER